MVNVKEINSYNEFNSFKGSNNNMLNIVKIGAEWCGPCRMMSDLIHGLDEDKVDGVLFSEIDIEGDGMDAVAVDYSIRNIPVLLFFKNGEMLHKHVGSLNADGIYNLINEYK